MFIGVCLTLNIVNKSCNPSKFVIIQTQDNKWNTIVNSTNLFSLSWKFLEQKDIELNDNLCRFFHSKHVSFEDPNKKTNFHIVTRNFGFAPTCMLK